MAEITIPDIIKIGDISTYLSANYEGEGNLFGERLAVTSPQSIQLVTDALRWQWEAFPDTEGGRATSTITITSDNTLGTGYVSLYVNDPLLGTILLGDSQAISYGSNVNDIAYSIWSGINGNPNTYGYNVGPEPIGTNTFIVIAPSGRGSSMNGVSMYFKYTDVDFDSTITLFSGGVNATIRGVANYLQWMCGKFGLTAQYIMSGISGGTVMPIFPVYNPDPVEFVVSPTSIVPSGNNTGLIPSFVGINIIFIRGGLTQSTLNTGGSYFTWNKGTGTITCNPSAYTGELFQIYPTI